MFGTGVMPCPFLQGDNSTVVARRRRTLLSLINTDYVQVTDVLIPDIPDSTLLPSIIHLLALRCGDGVY